jgi:hypothetical protein
MNNDNRESRPDAIERLIADEEAAALDEFRMGDFRACVERRIAEETRAGEGRRASFAGRFLRPAVVTAGAALVCVVVAFLILPRSSSSNGTTAMIQRALLGMPGLPSPDMTTAINSEAAGVSAGVPSLSFAAVLASARDEMAAGERAGDVSSAARGGDSRAPRLSLQEKYEILIIEKSVERVLTQLANKFKEG